MDKSFKQQMVMLLSYNHAILNYKEGGNSMVPLIYSKQPVDIFPVFVEAIEKGDILFCKVNGRFMTHKVTAVKEDQVQISNNHGHVNGWAKMTNVFGIIGRVESKWRSGISNKISALEIASVLPAKTLTEGVWSLVTNNKETKLIEGRASPEEWDSCKFLFAFEETKFLWL